MRRKDERKANAFEIARVPRPRFLKGGIEPGEEPLSLARLSRQNLLVEFRRTVARH